MYYVYVHYPLDNEKAIMPQSLIKNCARKSDNDIPWELVQAYWPSETDDEEYYEAKVLLLANK